MLLKIVQVDQKPYYFKVLPPPRRFKRTRINFDTAKTTNVVIKLRRKKPYTQSGFGAVSIKLLDLNNSPYPNISLCLTSISDPTQKIYSISNAQGTAVFTAKAGRYIVDTLIDNFPLEEYLLPESFNVSIQENSNDTYTLKLIAVN